MPGACDVLIENGRTALQCFRSLDVPSSKASCNDFANAVWLVCVIVAVLLDILVAIGVGLTSVMQVMLVGSLEILHEQR